MDVRSAVTGYRNPTLPGELAGARTALAAAGITADIPADAPEDLPRKPEEVLAWGIREAVTNVVRHSGARHCTITLTRRQTLDGPLLELVVADDGRGAPDPKAGNGLTGTAERLAAVEGTLVPGPVGGGGPATGTGASH
ncbi:sensor histidine kinase [Streptomyces sp. NPDC060035]|uniref:sensor histidine kinase n=1 Tax=Streptomyces sp. NPDC060035 TaxID=3347044 RepID=UPI00368CA68F